MIARNVSKPCRVVTLLVVGVWYDVAHCNETSKKNIVNVRQRGLQNACEKYNSLWNRLQWAERRNRCCAESGCVLIGRSITGTCTPVDISVTHRIRQQENNIGAKENEADVQEKDDEKGAIKLFVEVANEKSAEPLKILLRESVTASAVDSLRDSQQLAKELARKMALNYLNNSENIGETAGLVKRLLDDASIRAAAATFVNPYLTTVQSRRYILQFVYETKDYYLHPYSAGQLDCEQALVSLLDWWVRADTSRRQVIVPLLEWTISLEDIVRKPASELAAWALPAAQTNTNETFTWLAVTYLESEEAKKLAKDSIVSLLSSIR